jgi:hypothetical protein
MGDEDTSTAPTHTSGTRQGEEIKDEEGKESGRHDAEATHADRPSGGSTARDSTAINPDSVESDEDSARLR